MPFKWTGDKWLDKTLKRTAQGLYKSATFYQRKVKEQLNRYGAGQSPPGSPPGKQTGHLGRSIQIDDSDLHTGLSAGVFTVRVGSNVPYAKIHEIGGKISAKKAKALTVPLNKKARKMAAGVRSVRELDLVFIKRKGKPPLLAKSHGGKQARIEPLFILKKSVRIPRRPYMVPTLARHKEDLKNIYAEHMRAG